jgi:hypothetical protein
MSNVVEISELPEDEMLDALKSKPIDFFKELKELPDQIAAKIYKVSIHFLSRISPCLGLSPSMARNRGSNQSFGSAGS